MNEPRPPTAEEQLAFLRSLQRLLDEGKFTSSYKFALLHAIADLSILKGDDSGAELELSTSEIAEQFVRLYWAQTAPYPASDEQPILRQSTGRPAAIVREVAKHHSLYQGSLADLKRSFSDWERVRCEVERTVRKMPLWKLQTVGSERLEFLYKNSPRRRYPLDLGHNFVLAHQGCNSSKSDLLAAEEHLARWTERNRIHRDELRDGFDELKVLHDWPATRGIAHYAYGQVQRDGGQVWVQARELRPLSDEWRRILAAA